MTARQRSTDPRDSKGKPDRQPRSGARRNERDDYGSDQYDSANDLENERQGRVYREPRDSGWEDNYTGGNQGQPGSHHQPNNRVQNGRRVRQGFGRAMNRRDPYSNNAQWNLDQRNGGGSQIDYGGARYAGASFGGRGNRGASYGGGYGSEEMHGDFGKGRQAYGGEFGTGDNRANTYFGGGYGAQGGYTGTGQAAGGGQANERRRQGRRDDSSRPPGKRAEQGWPGNYGNQGGHYGNDESKYGNQGGYEIQDGGQAGNGGNGSYMGGNGGQRPNFGGYSGNGNADDYGWQTPGGDQTGYGSYHGQEHGRRNEYNGQSNDDVEDTKPSFPAGKRDKVSRARSAASSNAGVNSDGRKARPKIDGGSASDSLTRKSSDTRKASKKR